MSRALERLWYREREGALAQVLLSPLWLLSLLFRAVVRRRRRYWTDRAARVDAKVISIGGLTVGGAGKTPVVAYLASRLRRAGQAPAVLSRGYGRDRPGAALVVSKGPGPQVGVREAGDEPTMLARTCPGVPILVGPERAAIARHAVEKLGARTLVLDDGFQHVRLARDLDVVVLDASNPFGNGHLLPRGPLRDPKDALGAAGLVWLSKVDQAPQGAVEALEAEVRRFTRAPIVRSGYAVVDVLDDSGASLGPQALAGKRVMMLAGLARPGSFRRTLESVGAIVVEERLLPDHGWFRPMDVEAAKLDARRLGLEAIAMTEKDAVRLPDSARRGPFVVVRIEVVILAGEDALGTIL